MLTIRKAADRGVTSFGWLDSRHSFSFGQYRDPDNMGFGPLRVINDDRVAPGKGFPEHPHRNMEIISYVVEGRLAHKDSTGAEREVGRGGIQRMTAGRGVYHSEFNPSSSEPTRLLQIWIEPEAPGLDPSYEDRLINPDDEPGKLHVIATRHPSEGQAIIHQDATVYAGVFKKDDAATLAIGAGRRAWIQVVTGELAVNGETLTEGDGAALTDEPSVELTAVADGTELLVFDLP
ncbi:MAG: quercetin 2,3-dioxygenase [Phycisphaerae bacterium]|nr:quercetin 2,3-dioxygenase [Phycisphaerae bacterium]